MKITRYQTNTALSAVTTLNHPVLLSDQEKLGADCMTIQFQQFCLPVLHTTKLSRERGKLPMKRVYVSPQKSCEPSPSKVAKVVGSEHSYASTTDNAHYEVNQLKKTVKIVQQKV